MAILGVLSLLIGWAFVFAGCAGPALLFGVVGFVLILRGGK